LPTFAEVAARFAHLRRGGGAVCPPSRKVSTRAVMVTDGCGTAPGAAAVLEPSVDGGDAPPALPPKVGKWSILGREIDVLPTFAG